MPLYEYQCEECGHDFERLVFHDEEEVRCPKCRGDVRKLFSPFSSPVPDEVCGKLPKGEQRELCTECREGGGACPFSA
ncbi:MAG: zinc ribbon domain-containing protein [Deltaproteobacteria bacterium]|nr:zinc ribbon domain-containing protein [Deltaproteobacteria bacterium]